MAQLIHSCISSYAPVHKLTRLISKIKFAFFSKELRPFFFLFFTMYRKGFGDMCLDVSKRETERKYKQRCSIRVSVQTAVMSRFAKRSTSSRISSLETRPETKHFNIKCTSLSWHCIDTKRKKQTQKTNKKNQQQTNKTKQKQINLQGSELYLYQLVLPLDHIFTLTSITSAGCSCATDWKLP